MKEAAQLAENAVHLAELVHEEIRELAVCLGGFPRLEKDRGAAARVPQSDPRHLAPVGRGHRDGVAAVPQRDEGLGDAQPARDRLELLRETLAEGLDGAADPREIRARLVPHLARGLECLSQLAMERRQGLHVREQARKSRRFAPVLSRPRLGRRGLIEEKPELPELLSREHRALRFELIEERPDIGRRGGRRLLRGSQEGDHIPVELLRRARVVEAGVAADREHAIAPRSGARPPRNRRDDGGEF